MVEQVNRLIHSDDPRWLYIPDDPAYAGGLLFTYMASSPIPGALQEFVSPNEDEASIVFFYKDHKGVTIRRAFHMLKSWINDPANQVEGLRFELAGGIIGVTAAGNEAAFETNMVVLPLVLLLIFFFCDRVLHDLPLRLPDAGHDDFCDHSDICLYGGGQYRD